MPGTVIVTASAGSFPGLVEALRAIPAAVEEIPLMTFAPPLDWSPVDAALAELGRFDAVAFTSPRSAGAFMGRASQLGAVMPPSTTVWAGGAGTAQALGTGLGPVRRPNERAVGEQGVATALAVALLAAGIRGPVLFPCGDLRRDELPARLRGAGVAVEEVVCYRSVLATELEARRATERGQLLVVGSPSVAELLARACPRGARPALLAAGPTTAAAARASGWEPAGVAARPTTEALAAAARELMAPR
jgi:uroporphyrinogen-III synthase